MLEVSKRFKERSFENLKTDLIAKVSIVGGDEITHENGFLSFKILEEAGIASTSMAVATLTLKGFVELIDKSFYLSYGYKFDGEEDYLTFGPFKVVEQSYDEKTKKSTFIAYDLMYEFCKEYKMDFKEFPMKADKYLEEISHVIGVENEITTIPYVIKQDYYNGTGYEVRRAVENVVELSNQIAFFRYGKLTNKSFEEVDVTLTKSNLTGFTILPQFGPVDSLVLSRTPQEDNVYPAVVNPETVKHEVKISNNLIVDLERENVIDTLFPRYEDLTLQPFSLSTIGLGFLELGDIVKASIDDKSYDLTILGKELVITNGIKETLFCEEVSKSSTKYQYASDSRRNQITTELLVDKQKGEIKSLIKEVGDRTDKDTSITQDVDSINAKVQSISVGTNLILNLNALLDMVNNTYPYYIFNPNVLRTPFRTPERTSSFDTPIFKVVTDKNSISGYSKQYEFKGKVLATEYAYIVPDTIYSYRCKRTKGNTPMDVYVVEYDGDKKQINRTKFTLDGQNMIESFSFTPAQMTMWARLEFYVNQIGFEIFNDFERGTIKTGVQDGETLEDIKSSIPNNRMRSNSLINISEGQGITIPDGYEAIAYYFELNGKSVGVNTGWNQRWISSKNYPRCALLVRKIDGSDFSEFEGVKTFEGFRITEEMFVRGEPVKWSEDANEVKAWAQTQLNMIDDTILMSAKRVDSLNADIHNSGVEINAVEGVTTYGKKFKVMDSNRTRTLMEVVTEGGRDITRAVDFEATNANISGTITTNKLTATGGTVGGYTISGENLIGNDVKLGKNSIDIGNTNIKGGIAADILHISASRLNIGAIRSSGSVEFAIGDETILQKDVNSDFVSARIDMIGPKKSGYAIGDNHNRYSYIFLQNQPNVSSDVRTKYNITNIDDRLLDYFEELEEKSFITKHDDLFSFGYIAQDVERVLYRYCVDKRGYREANEWLKKFKLLNKSESYLSLLYNEIGIIMHAVKNRKIDRLEAENKQLRREHDTLVEILREKGVI
ncbi:MAG: tail fiber domain-containing protein [Erysipelothrix sp.]